MKLVTIGTVYVDIKGYPDNADFVPAGRNAGQVGYFHGGVARNIAEDVAVLGENSCFVGLVDKSGAGADVVKHLQQIGMAADYIRAAEDGMGTWLAIFKPDGDLCANISKRPNLLPICDILVEQGEAIFADADSLLLEMDIDEPIVAKAMELAEQYHIPVYGVISNMTIGMERLEYIKRTSCFICNRLEAGIFFDRNIEGLEPATMLEMLQQGIQALGMKAMVVTLDAEGSVYAEAEGESGICSALPLTVVDTTGAGDAFFAGTSVGLTRGLTLAEACQLGTKAAAGVLVRQENVLAK